MLSSIRSGLNSWFVKALLVVLAIIFLFSGFIGLVKNKNIAFTIGDVEYSKEEWSKVLRTGIARLGAKQADPNILARRIFSDFIVSELLKIESKKLGIVIDDVVAVQYIIKNIPDLVIDRKFNTEKFEAMLKNNGLNKEIFMDSVKDQISSNVLAEVFHSTPVVDETLEAQLAFALCSGRKVRVFELESSKIDEKSNPTEDELKVVFKENLSIFTVPEVRKVSILQIPAELIIDKSSITVSEQEMLQAFNSMKEKFTSKELRKVQTLVFKTKDDALKAADSKSSFEEIATQYNIQYDTNPSYISSYGLDSNIAEVIFSMPLGNMSKPILTPIGWSIFKVIDIIPSTTKNFDLLKEELGSYIYNQKYTDIFNDKLEEIEKRLVSGTDITSISISYGLKLKTDSISGDYEKDTESESKITAQAAFSTQKGDVSGVKYIDKRNAIVLKVDDIIESHTLDFSNVKNTLISIYEKNFKKQEAMKLMSSFRQRLIDENIEVGDIPSERKYVPLHSHIFETEIILTKETTIPQDVLQNIFSTKVGSFSKIFEQGGKIVTMRVLSTITPTEDDLKKSLNNIKGSIDNLFQQFIFLEYIDLLKKKYPIKIYNLT